MTEPTTLNQGQVSIEVEALLQHQANHMGARAAQDSLEIARLRAINDALQAHLSDAGASIEELAAACERLRTELSDARAAAEEVRAQDSGGARAKPGRTAHRERATDAQPGV